MAASSAVDGEDSRSLLLWPTLLTLAVTLLRFAGELRGWPPEYFSRLPGGGLSPLGITWLAPLVGFYFGWRLERVGVRSPSPAVAFGVLLLASARLVPERLQRTGYVFRAPVLEGALRQLLA